MKKVIALLLCIMMVLSSFVLPAFAVSEDDSDVNVGDILDSFDISLTSADAVPYSQAVLSLNVLNNPGFAVMKLTLSFDSDKLTLSDVQSDIDVQFTQNAGYAVVTFFSLGSDCVTVGELAKLTFSVGACSGVNEITLSAEEGDICNNEAQILYPSLISGQITSDCEHIYVYQSTTAPSCSDKGEIVYVCNICNDKSITYIDTTPHVQKSEWEIIKQPDCDDSGINALLCQYCSTVLDSQEIAPNGHKYGDYTVTKEPECETVGSHYRDCAICYYREITDIEPLGHDDGTWRTTIPSDCVNSGVASRHCDRCDKVLETMSTQVGEHFMSWVTTVEPTCSSEGKEEYLCVICGSESQESRTVSKLSHIEGAEETVRHSACGVTGLVQTKCTLCDEVLNSYETEALEHKKSSLIVVNAPTLDAQGLGEYHCLMCGETVESVVLDKVDGRIYMNDITVAAGKNIKIPVIIENNTGFSVGIVRVRYNVESLMLKAVSSGDVTEDITVGYTGEGELNVLVSLTQEQYSKNGVLFYLEVALTENAVSGKIELYYDPQNDFSAENGDRVFFNISGGTLTVENMVIGDADNDGDVDTADLALLKLHLAGEDATVSMAVDMNDDGVITTTDLAKLKILLLTM